MQESPRVLVVSIFFSPEPIGISKFTTELAQFLSGSGHAVRVITAFPFYPQWRLWEGYPVWRYHKELLNQIEIIRCPLWVPNRVNGMTRILHLLSFGISSSLATLAQITWKPDLVFLVLPTAVNMPSCLLLSRLTNSKTWLHVQDFELDLARNLGILRGTNRLLNMLLGLEKRLFARFKMVSTISESMQKRLSVDRNVSEIRTYMVPNWVDCNKIYPLDEESKFREELGIGRGQVVALYSGNMGRKYGLDDLAAVAHRLLSCEDLFFVFCGDGVGREEFEASCSDFPNVRFLPLQPTELLNELLNLADIHLLPQKYDASDSVMPSRLLNMMASGRPIVATVTVDSEVAMAIGDCGLITPSEDIEAFATALLTLAHDFKLRRSMGKQARELAEEHYAKETILGRFTREVKTLLET